MDVSSSVNFFCFNFLLIFGEGMEGQIDSLVAHLG